MDAPGEVLLDVFLFLRRFDAENCRQICRKWFNVVRSNEALWEDELPFTSVTDRSLPTRSELLDDPVDPVFDEAVEYDESYRKYTARQIIRLITSGDADSRAPKVGWLVVNDNEYLDPCTEDCDFHGSRSRPNANVRAHCRVTLGCHVSATNLLDFILQRGTPLIYYFGGMTHIEFVRQFLADTACLCAELVTIAFGDSVMDVGILDKAIVDYCFSAGSCKRQLYLLSYLPSAELLLTIAERFVNAPSTESFPRGVWIDTISMAPEELRLNPPPCLPLSFSDADKREVGYVYVVQNTHTLELLSLRIYGFRIRLKKLAANHTLTDIVC